MYSGVDEGDLEKAEEFEGLAKDRCSGEGQKQFLLTKIKTKQLKSNVLNVENEFADIVDMGYNRKSNCDVDLTVDAMEYSGPNTEFYIFTGDGDFEYLIRKVVSKSSVVHIVSSAKK